MANHPEIRLKMGLKSRARFLECYTKDKFIEGLSGVFNSVFTER
jgi:hypothetical protein